MENDNDPMSEQQPEPPAEEIESASDNEAAVPIWRLSDSEWRILLITVVGGVASVVISAVLIGGAIAFSRWLVSGKGFSGIFGGLVFVSAINFIALALFIHGYFHATDRKYSTADNVLFIGNGIVSVFLTLTWIGIAAGIH